MLNAQTSLRFAPGREILHDQKEISCTPIVGSGLRGCDGHPARSTALRAISLLELRRAYLAFFDSGELYGLGIEVAGMSRIGPTKSEELFAGITEDLAQTLVGIEPSIASGKHTYSNARSFNRAYQWRACFNRVDTHEVQTLAGFQPAPKRGDSRLSLSVIFRR